MSFRVQLSTGHMVQFENRPTQSQIDELERKFRQEENNLRQHQPQRDGFLASMAKDPIDRLVVRPGVRAGQAIGAGLVTAFGNEETKNNLHQALNRDTNVPIPGLGNITVPPVGGAKQQIGEAATSAAYLAGGGTMQAAKGLAGGAMSRFGLGALKGGPTASIGRLARQTTGVVGLGAISGGLAGFGGAMERGASFGQTAGQTVAGGVIGAGIATGAGAIPGLAIPMGVKGAQMAYNLLPSGIKQSFQKLAPEQRNNIVNEITDSVFKSFSADRQAVTTSLQRHAQKTVRSGDLFADERLLVREMIEEGYFPRVEGNLARYGQGMIHIGERIGTMAEGIQRALPGKTVGTTNNIRQRAMDQLTNDPRVRSGELPQARNELNRLFAGFRERFGNNMTDRNINTIRMEMVRKTGAFRGDRFSQDTENVIGDVAREILDEMFPSGVVRSTNEEIARQMRIRTTMKIFDNRKIDIGTIGEAAGRLAGVTTLPTVLAAGGVGTALGGPITGGGLVIAGMMANVGGKVVGNFLRRKRFDPQIQKFMLETLKRDRPWLDKMLKEMTPDDARWLRNQIQRLDETVPIGGVR